MRKILLTLLLSSCITTKTASPVDAGLPDLKFWYWKSGSYVQADGQGSNYFTPGEQKRFKVETTGKCSVRYIDGDNDQTKPCEKEVYFDFGQYLQTSPEVASIVVISDSGSHYGVFYPTLRQQREVLPLEFACPQQETTHNVSVCARPAGYKFQFTVKTDEAGKLLYTKQCSGSGLTEEIIELKEPTARSFSLESAGQNYCTVGFGFKKPSGHTSSHVLHVRFYNPKYMSMGD